MSDDVGEIYFILSDDDGSDFTTQHGPVPFHDYFPIHEKGDGNAFCGHWTCFLSRRRQMIQMAREPS